MSLCWRLHRDQILEFLLQQGGDGVMKLVLADDEHIVRQGLLTIKWEDLGFTVVGVGTNGLETLDLARKTQPHLVLTDIRMPGIDGIELAKILQEELPATKIIFLTAHHDFDYAYAAVKMNVMDFLLKPTEPEEILASVERVKKSIQQEIERKNTMASMSRQLRQHGLLADEGLPSDLERPHKRAVQESLEYIAANYKEDITLASTAEAVHLSTGYLCRLLKNETGQTFLEILTRIRMEQAALLLQDRDMMIYEIAEQVGFKDARYFSRVFREHHGLNPTDYRTKLFQEER